jgi:hypothetical protein
MKIQTAEHLKHPWLAHTFLDDFVIEDVWRFPIQLSETHTIADFQKEFKTAMEELSQKGVAGWLFKLRFFLGKIFGWDANLKTNHLHLKKGSLRERYAQLHQLQAKDLPSEGMEEFIPVYLKEQETLLEIENETVHAAMHLGKVPYKDHYTVQMAVYVKPKGNLGRFYMALIKPFRLAIVYPQMIRIVAQQWLKSQNT